MRGDRFLLGRGRWRRWFGGSLISGVGGVRGVGDFVFCVCGGGGSGVEGDGSWAERREGLTLDDIAREGEIEVERNWMMSLWID